MMFVSSSLNIFVLCCWPRCHYAYITGPFLNLGFYFEIVWIHTFNKKYREIRALHSVSLCPHLCKYIAWNNQAKTPQNIAWHHNQLLTLIQILYRITSVTMMILQIHLLGYASSSPSLTLDTIIWSPFL